MRRVLVIAFYFPPQGGAGVQRTLKFVKYLPEFGWQPIVLTVTGSDSTLRDESLAREVPSTVSVHRTPALLLPRLVPWRVRRWLTRWLLVVDEQVGWLPFAVARGKCLIQETGIAVIYTTSAPYTDHLIGLWLKRATGRPWVADLRDPWVDNPALAFASPFHRRWVERLERQTFLEADRVVVNTATALDFYRRKYPGLEGGRLLAIPNGYDPDDLADVAPAPLDRTRFQIVHVGSLYGQMRTARPFLQALRNLMEARTLPRQRVQVSFVGNVGHEVAALVQEYALDDVVRLIGYVPHRESIAYLLAADLLLLIPTSGPGSEVFIPAKAFEYLAVGRPILTLATPGAAADLIAEAHAGPVVDPNDVLAIAAHLAALYNRWQQGDLAGTTDPQVVARHDRRVLAGRLAAVLDEAGTRG